MEIVNTIVAGDPDACDRAADWCSKMSHGLHEIGSDLHGVKSASESSWEGTAGDAFRSKIGSHASTADDLVGKADKVKDAIHLFAGELRTVESRIAAAREVARGGGCELTPDGIIDPGPIPEPTGLAAVEGLVPLEQEQERAEAIDSHNAAVRHHFHQSTAFKEAKATVEEMRRKESEAHATLGHSLQSFQLQEFNDAKTQVVRWTTNGIGGVRIVKGVSDDLLNRSKVYAQNAERLSVERFGWWKSFGQRADAFATRTAGNVVGAPARLFGDRGFATISADPLNRLAHVKPDAFGGVGSDALRKVGDKARVFDRLGHATPSLLGDSAGLSAAKFGSRVVKGIPFVGTAITIGSGAIDYADGSKSGGEVIGETAGGIAGGAIGAAAFSFIPVIGTTFGTCAGGVVGGMIGSKIGGWFSG